MDFDFSWSMPSFRTRIIYSAILVLLMCGEAIDVTNDFIKEGITTGVVLDLALFFFVGLGVGYILYQSSRDLQTTHGHLLQARKDLEDFRNKNKEVLRSMREAILLQFQNWGLSPSETRVAEFLIRGYSTRQMGAMLKKSERTVRNQALAVYRKSGMTGRSDLSAFFLQDIMGEEEEASLAAEG
ncbi:MAG: helix-turn-helix transcriptional regulator [Leptospirales bacterium]|nr:helix-turn-helix transcriptional regulator [Leptospirales bacterium]